MGKFSFFEDWESQISLTYLGKEVNVPAKSLDQPTETIL
jgi:hypothetical protein